MTYSLRYFEVQQTIPTPPYIKTMYVTNLPDAVRLSRFMAVSEKRECLIREVKDILYMSTHGDVEPIEMSRRVMDAIVP